MDDFSKYLTLMNYITPKVIEALKFSGVDEPSDDEVFLIANAWIDEADALGWLP